ncbi:MAG: hypothetical protein ACK5JE_09580 [Castellaniella sp.]|uniref:hypothetical protein n=1 Tax=Castellaniella sp. TaxID=1955812 RepID=UPI003A8C35C4
MALVLAEQWLRLPLHLPGWRGGITIALLVAAHRLGPPAFACAGAAAVALAFSVSLGSALLPGVFHYLLPALVLDLCLRRPRPGILGAALVGGLANIARLLPVLAGSRVPGVSDGMLWFPFSTHFLSGACGGLIASLALHFLHTQKHGPHS